MIELSFTRSSTRASDTTSISRVRVTSLQNERSNEVSLTPAGSPFVALKYCRSALSCTKETSAMRACATWQASRVNRLKPGSGGVSTPATNDAARLRSHRQTPCRSRGCCREYVALARFRYPVFVSGLIGNYALVRTLEPAQKSGRKHGRTMTMRMVSRFPPNRQTQARSMKGRSRQPFRRGPDAPPE